MSAGSTGGPAGRSWCSSARSRSRRTAFGHDNAATGASPMSPEDRKCPKCGGPTEAGFVWATNSVGEVGATRVERCGWMAGGDLEYKKVGVWPLKVEVPTNERRPLTASRCTACGLVEFYA